MNLKSLSTLQIALSFSLAVHAVLLTVRFVDPESFNRVFQDTPLEVILVNAKTNERAPDKAQAIAQTALQRGLGNGLGLVGRAFIGFGIDQDHFQRRVLEHAVE